MRRLVWISALAFALAAPAVGFALSGDDDGTLSVKAGVGRVSLNFNGSAVGRLQRGSIQVTDPVAGDGVGFEFTNCDLERDKSDTTTNRNDTIRVCIGTNMRFRAIGGKYQVLIRGSGIYLSAVRRVIRWDTEAVAASQAQTVLVVEDEASIASFISLYLKNAGYRVKAVSSGGDALAQVEVEQPALIVLDLMLPDMDGIDVCRRIRQRKDIPILMLTARDEDVDKIIGLEVGADDYMTKPFNPRELVARVKSILRRVAPDRKDRETAVLQHGDLVIDAGRREVKVGAEEIQLAPKEFDLLWELLDHRGLVLTRDQLLERVWGYTFAGDTRTVDVHEIGRAHV